jgi:hypothetical protein
VRPLCEAACNVVAEGGLNAEEERLLPYRLTTEVGRLGVAMNEMLATIERTVTERDDARRRTEQFAVDASPRTFSSWTGWPAD